MTIGKPAGVSSGDVLVAFISTTGATVTSPPSGWSLIRSELSSSGYRLYAYSHVAGGSEPASYDWTFSADTESLGAIVAYTGVDNGNPVNTHSGQTDVTTGTQSVVAPSVTPSVTGCWLIGGFMSTDGTVTWTPPTGMTERVDAHDLVGLSLEVTDENYGTTSASGTRTATQSSSTTWMNAQLIVLQPTQPVPDVCTWLPVRADRILPVQHRKFATQFLTDPTGRAALGLTDPPTTPVLGAWRPCEANRILPVVPRPWTQAYIDPTGAATVVGAFVPGNFVGKDPAVRFFRRPFLEGGLSSGTVPPQTADTVEIMAAVQQTAARPRIGRPPPLPYFAEAQPLSPPPNNVALFRAWEQPLSQPLRSPGRRLIPGVDLVLTAAAVVPFYPDWDVPPQFQPRRQPPGPAWLNQEPWDVLVDTPTRAALWVQPATAPRLARPRSEPPGVGPPALFAVETQTLGSWRVDLQQVPRPVPHRPGPAVVQPPPAVQVEQPRWPLWDAVPVLPLPRKRLPPGQGGPSALLPLPNVTEAVLCVWGMLWPGPRAAPHLPPAALPATQRVPWWAGLEAAPLLAWNVAPVLPRRMPQVVIPAGRSPLPVTTAGDGMAWRVEGQCPWPRPGRTLGLADTNFTPPLQPTVVVVAGPYYAAAGEIFVAGAAAGEIDTE